MKKIAVVGVILCVLALIGQAILQKRQPQLVTQKTRHESKQAAPNDKSTRTEEQRPVVDLRGKRKIAREEVLYTDPGLESEEGSSMMSREEDEREGGSGNRNRRYRFVAPMPRYAQQGTLNSAQLNARPTEQKLDRASRSFTGDLRNLPEIKPEKVERPEREGPAPVPRIVGDPNTTLSPTTTTKSVAPINAPAPAPLMNFAGLDFNNWGNGHPPDTVGDVGPEYYIQAINTSIGIFRKSDGVRVAAFTFNTFMSQGNFGNLCDTNNFGDPVILYDTFEDRWVITDFAFRVDSGGNVVSPPGAFQCFAVSKNGDPVTGGWNYYSLPVSDALHDYPKLGIWPDGIYMSANMFGFPASGTFQGPRVWALNKAQMYAGAPTIQVVSFNGPADDFTLLPANARLQTGTPPPGTPNYFVSTWQFLNGLTVYKFHVDWEHISLSTFTGPDVPLAATSWPNASVPNAPSQGGNNLDVLQIRAMMQNQYTRIAGAESLWTTHTVRRGNTTGFAAPRWYQVNVTGGAVDANLPQAATWDPDGANVMHRFIPSLAVDRVGNLALGYSTSSSTTKPAIKYAGRLATDPPNTFSQTEQVLIQGAGTQTGNCGGSACTRWGDYSAMSLAPDGCTFWYTTMYYATNGLNHQTQIGSFTLPSCSQVATTGTIQGTVTAAVGGAPISNATVKLGSRTATTDGAGVYQFADIPAGTYPGITASAPGFSASSVANLNLAAGATLTQDFALNVAPVTACLTDTTQLDFQGGIPTNVDLTTSPGDVTLLDAPTINPQNTTLGTSGNGISTTAWSGQTFRAGVTGQLVKADINLFCSACTGTAPVVTVSVRATSAGLPTGPDLAAATFTTSTSGAGGYFTANFSSPPMLSAGTTYALVIRNQTNPSAGTNAVSRSNNNAYANGARVTSTNSGATWAAQTTDIGFRIYMQTGYAASGTLVSGVKDSNPYAGETAHWLTLSWTATTPAGTEVKFQVAGSNNPAGVFNFVGPDGTAATFFTSSGASLRQFDGQRYLQYKAYLSTSDGTLTPTLQDVTICYDNPKGIISGDATICLRDMTNVTVTVNGGTPPYTVVLSNGGGTQTGAGPVFTFPVSPTANTNYTLAAGSKDASDLPLFGVGSATVMVTVIQLSPPTLPDATVGTPYSVPLLATPADTYTYAVTSGTLPAGLSLNPLTGELSGMPTTNGFFTFGISATGSTCTNGKLYTLFIKCAGFALSPTSLPNAQAGAAYSQTVTAAGATNYILLAGNLPPGLNLNAGTGALTGTPAATGTYTFTIQASAPGNCTTTQAYTLVVTCPTLVVAPATATLPGGTLGTVYSQTFSVTPAGNYSFAKTGGALPPGLSLSSAGVLSGTPITQGTYNFTVTATGFGSCAGSQSYTLVVTGNCATITLPVLPATGKVGTNYFGNLASTTPSGSYTFSVESGTLPPGLSIDNLFGALTGKPTTVGAYTFRLLATRSNGCTGIREYTVTVSSGASMALAQSTDFDGDGSSDLTLWTAANGRWQILRSSDEQLQTPLWGGAGDLTLQGDYDGDGVSDLAVYRPGNGTWYVKRSSNGSALIQVWGAQTDVPVPGDYDGDGKTDVAVWRPSEGNWYVLKSSDGSYDIVTWGLGVAPYLDVPVPGDYDGDGVTDLAVFRRSSGLWLIQRSSDGQYVSKTWGGATDVPVVGDYDGDGQSDIAVWRGATGEWFVLRSADGGYNVTKWGAASVGDVPAPGDYDGDGRFDLAVWRSTEGAWYVLQSSDGVLRTRDLGQRGDLPIAARQ